MRKEQWDWLKEFLNPYLQDWFSLELCDIMYDDAGVDTLWIGIGIRKMIAKEAE